MGSKAREINCPEQRDKATYLGEKVKAYKKTDTEILNRISDRYLILYENQSLKNYLCIP